MSNRLKSFALATLVFSLTCGVGLAANDVVVKYTMAQTNKHYRKLSALKYYLLEGVRYITFLVA
jgi:hypothetical protein